MNLPAEIDLEGAADFAVTLEELDAPDSGESQSPAPAAPPGLKKKAG